MLTTYLPKIYHSFAFYLSLDFDIDILQIVLCQKLLGISRLPHPIAHA